MKLFIFIIFMQFTSVIYSQTRYPEINREIAEGNFTKAAELIDTKIASDKTVTAEEKWDLEFQKDKMERIRMDFRRDRNYIMEALAKYYPELTDEMMEKWEKEKSLEMKIIDGEKRYFRNSVPNLFRINKEARQLKLEKEGTEVDRKNESLSENIPSTIEKAVSEKVITANPVEIKIDYTVTVDADAVPDGEVIRCWLPYPREGIKRQQDVKLISVNEDNYLIADNEYLQRTLYLEKTARKGEPTVFNLKLSYVSSAEWHNIDPGDIKPYDKDSEFYKTFTAERAPHIVFTIELKELSDKIVGDEKNPYLAAKKIFTWIDNNIPWASAREYSTLENIPAYCYENRHGDCGIQTLLFMTLARINGIPTKWQSGWMMHPNAINLHDWSEMYLEGYGWVPVDQSFGMWKSGDEKEKYFYLGGIDSYRMIVNDDYSQALYPAKIYPRSETVDFQRGELEWRGGNLYFNKWDYYMKVEYQEK